MTTARAATLRLQRWPEGPLSVGNRLRRARFDGRTEGLAPRDDDFILGWHCYMTPEVAAEGLMRLSLLPDHNDDLPNDDYPDLSTFEIFQ